MLIQILCDNINSWLVPYIHQWVLSLPQQKYKAKFIFSAQDVTEGDILILLACEKLFKNLHLNQHNLVVHESALPHGKGWSPMTWQILEGQNRIPVTLIEAQDDIDSGPIYGVTYVELDGTELVEEIRVKQAEATFRLLENFLEKYPTVVGINQKGDESFYPRRRPGDSELSINKSIAEQFNLFRVCDNERYPAYFVINKTKYILKIYKENERHSD